MAPQSFPHNEQDWKTIANGFNERFQFINSGGAPDVKHIRIKPYSRAKNYNYTNFYSIILMALVDSNYEFIYDDVGKQGRLSNSGAIEWTKFYQLLKTGNLKCPPKNANVVGLNFVIIDDESFALYPHFLRPYSQGELTYDRKVFNYRLSRARNVAEDAFGMLAARFRVLHRMINITDPNKIKYIVLACCVLHNFLRRNSNTYYSVQSSEKNTTITPLLS
ncbi:hypothetical protein NQ314_019352 [Rhamnusium bicolor]|uniref:DDE Tnp4 domain-containing protein n=1 Tax=Rhamnusium bicolor TaxID=1586634 RepID=A0AAV8WNT7_9CUCU|nr:hypothetical protein NQ314_019352 [Rhamnusium bicolor]